MKTPKLISSGVDFLRKDVLASALLALGLLAPIGYVLDFKPLRGLGVAWMVSPLPIVFSDSNGYEAFAARFEMQFVLDGGETLAKPIGFREASKLRGPYNRRNVFGAAIGYASRLPPKIVESVLRYGFCRRRLPSLSTARPALVEEFDLPNEILEATLVIVDGTQGRAGATYRIGVKCEV